MEGSKTELFALGDLKLQAGETLPDAKIAYTTFGNSKFPAITYPSWYSGGVSPFPQDFPVHRGQRLSND
jgi:homoserine acetyltransferase